MFVFETAPTLNPSPCLFTPKLIGTLHKNPVNRNGRTPQLFSSLFPKSPKIEYSNVLYKICYLSCCQHHWISVGGCHCHQSFYPLLWTYPVVPKEKNQLILQTCSLGSKHHHTIIVFQATRPLSSSSLEYFSGWLENTNS